MQLRRTIDPFVDIVDQGDEWVEYLAKDGSRWRINGTCNQCGVCEKGTVGRYEIIFTGEPGVPGSSYNIEGENRLDCPVRPEFCEEYIPECSLSGVYI